VGLARALSQDPVSVYDGLANPDEPYRFVAPPPGTEGRPAPTAAHGTARGGALDVATREVGPQFRLSLLGAEGVEVEVRPAAPTERVSGRIVNGNVYDVSVTGSSPVQGTVTMRATSSLQPGPTMFAQVPGRPWAALATTRTGLDVYSAPFKGPGGYALAFPLQAKKIRDDSHGPLLGLVGGLVVLAAIGLLVRAQARHRTRTSPVR
jgi:hypothetical protein